MSSRNYTGINIQFPISQDILSGKKIIETRTYSLPHKYMNKPLAFIETPGKQGKFKARVVAIIIFDSCFKYQSKEDFYNDFKKHLVDKDSPWAWKEKAKWGWRIKSIVKLKSHTPCKVHGIIYRKDIQIKID